MLFFEPFFLVLSAMNHMALVFEMVVLSVLARLLYRKPHVFEETPDTCKVQPHTSHPQEGYLFFESLHSVISFNECIGIVRVQKYRVVCLSVCVCVCVSVCLSVCLCLCVSALVWQN